MSRNRTARTLLLLAILALALGLRLYRIDAQSLWNDEGTTVALAQRDLATITQNAAHDIHPPLYYYLLHYWVAATGTSEFAARALSALLGTAAVAATYALARRLVSTIAALLAALIAALSPFQVYYAQEVRMYMLATLAGLLLMLTAHGLLAAWAAGERRLLSWRAAALVLAGTATLYTHYYGATLLLAVNVGLFAWWATRGRTLPRPWRLLFGWGALQALTLAAFSPWLLMTWRTLLGWPAVSAPMTLTELALNLMAVLPLGITVEMHRWTYALGLGLWALAGLGAVALWRDAGEGAARGRWRLALLVAYLLVPLGVMYLASLRQPMYNPKFILLTTPALHILQGAGIALVGGRWATGAGAPWRRGLRLMLAFVLLAVVVGASGWSLQRLYHDPQYARDDYRAAVEYIIAAAGPEAAILINAPSQIETVDYYYDGPLPMIPLATQRPVPYETAVAELSAIAEAHDQLFAIFWATADSDPEGHIESWLAEHTFKTMDRWYGNIRLVVYAVPDEPVTPMSHVTDYLLGDSIRLAGYTLLTPEPRSGEILQLALYWETDAPLDQRYTVFAQLLDPRQRIVGQHDSQPAGGRRPTDGWQPGDTMVDNHGILIRPGTIPGPHTLIVGLYNADDGQRLPVTGAQGALGDAVPLGDSISLGDAVALAEIVVEPPLRLPSPDELGMAATHAHDWGALTMAGHSLYRIGMAHDPNAPIAPGDALELVLFWRKDGAQPPNGAPTLVLAERSGRVVWQAALEPVQARYPWDAWHTGEIARDVHHLTLPPDLAPGRYTLQIQRPDGRRFTFQDMRVTAP